MPCLKSGVITATLCLLLCHPPIGVAADLPSGGSEYLGEIKRDANGHVVAIPYQVGADGNRLYPDGRILKVGPNESLHSIAAAAAVAQNGDTVEIEAGDYVGDVAVWKQDQLTIRGVNGKAHLRADGKSAEGKAIWVVRGGHVTIENITFSDTKVPDRNGAGIRFEQGHLIVRNCVFDHNENGILTASGEQTLEIVNSEFGYNGAGDGRSHGLYVGAIKLLKVTGSYFHHVKSGHLLKSRAAENHIYYNRLTDETGGTASYELEFPNGGIAYVVGNAIEQSPSTENPTMISFGAEGYKWPVNALYLTFNTLVDDRPAGGRYLVVKPGFNRLLAVNNLIAGPGKVLRNSSGEASDASVGTETFENNVSAKSSDFVQPSRYDYRLRKGALPGSRISELPTNIPAGQTLSPEREFHFPVGAMPLNGLLLSPGANQWRGD